MLTAGDVQFEPVQPKIWPLSTSVCVMVAGDSSLQTEILESVRRDVQARVEAEPNNWWKVGDIAELYAHYYCTVRQKRSERALLAPFGLNHNTFISRQSEMAESFVRQIATELVNFSLPDVSAIFTGTDPEGTHIFVANNADIACFDSVGFASIGIGRWHANSQFMFASHDRSKPFPDTLLLTYAAKKRAEVAPGVGEGTDMFTIGPLLGSYSPVIPDVLVELERMYQATRDRERRASLTANEEVNQYVQNLIAAAIPKEQKVATSDGGGNTPADQKDVRVEPAGGQPPE